MALYRYINRISSKLEDEQDINNFYNNSDTTPAVMCPFIKKCKY